MREILTRILKHRLLARALENILHRVLAHESVYADMRFLAHTMGTCHRLQVVLYIAVTLSTGPRDHVSNVFASWRGTQPLAPRTAGNATHIEDDHGVRGLQVNPQASRTCR